MKGLILAAGIASRLRPLTDNTPKCLLPVGQKSILERTIDNLILCGIKELIIVTGYFEDMIKSFVVKNYPDLKVHFVFNERYDSTNNVYSLWLAKKLIDNSDIILLDSDIIFDHRILELLMDDASKNRLAVRFEDNMGEEEMKVLITEDNHIRSISKEIEPTEAAGESMGMATDIDPVTVGEMGVSECMWLGCALHTVAYQPKDPRDKPGGFFGSHFFVAFSA